MLMVVVTLALKIVVDLIRRLFDIILSILPYKIKK